MRKEAKSILFFNKLKMKTINTNNHCSTQANHKKKKMFADVGKFQWTRAKVVTMC